MENSFLQKHLFIFSLSLIITAGILTNFPANVKAQQPRPLKYYGVDTAFPEDFATLVQYHINTVTVVLDANADETSWQPYFTAADTYNISVIVWPLGGGGECGFPYRGTDISPAHRLLDYLGRQEKFLGIINAHEPFWSCPMTVEEMATIKTKIKDYIRERYNREIKVVNYIDNIYPFPEIHNENMARIMDIAYTALHCIGGVEGSCQDALNAIRNDRDLINQAGFDGQIDLAYAFQTFGFESYGYRMPTAEEMREWGCQMLETDTLDGFFWYSWQNPASYSQYLAKNRYDDSGEDRWEAMDYVYEHCVNQPSTSPTPTPPPTSTPTPPSHCLPLGDIDCSGKVNSIDFSYLIAHYNTSEPKADLDNSGNVNALDVSRLLSNFGQTNP